MHAALPSSRIPEIHLHSAYAYPVQLTPRRREHIESKHPSVAMYAAAAGPSPSNSICTTTGSGRTTFCTRFSTSTATTASKENVFVQTIGIVQRRRVLAAGPV
jgi:hypothetical protein